MAVKAVVLAAGAGTRMKSDMPKVLQDLVGSPLIVWVLDSLAPVPLDEITAVVGHGADAVQSVLPPEVSTCLQEQQLGTGHAVQVALACLGSVDEDTVVVVPGDMPFLEASTLERLLASHQSTRAAATLLTTEIRDSDFGRIIRDDTGSVTGIVEVRDATPVQEAISEVNGGVYAFEGGLLAEALEQVDRDNAQEEYYLTDVIAILASGGHLVETVTVDARQLTGVNSHEQLAAAAELMRRRINERWMAAGVWMQDPARTYIGGQVTLAAGTRLFAGVHLEGSTEIGPGAVVGPDVYALDSQIGAGSRVWYSVLRSSQVGEGAQVGPYASLRPGTVLDASSKAGTFVEMKNTRVREGAKVPHLAYMGDADIGARANIGAGSITCNYDGVTKSKTTIGERAFIGSDTMLVAPVTVGDDAYTGAGSVISRDVSPGALAVERAEQKEIRDYAARVEARKKKRQAE